jgi:hypothetical protein
MAAEATSAEYKEAVTSLSELRERRAYECRLTPDRALDTIDDAAEFLRDRGMLTRTTDCSLPSLYEACQEEPYKAGGRGFASWPLTKWPWGAELSTRPGVHTLKVHRGKLLYLSKAAAALVDPICRAEIIRMEAADESWALLLRHLAATGPALLEDLQTELGLKPKELKAIRSPLERCGAVVARGLVLDAARGGHTHTSELARWDQAYPGTAENGGGLAELVVAGIHAAVLCPEREPKRWFSWAWRWEDALIGRLVDEGLLYRPEPGWLAAP